MVTTSTALLLLSTGLAFGQGSSCPALEDPSIEVHLTAAAQAHRLSIQKHQSPTHEAHDAAVILAAGATTAQTTEWLNGHGISVFVLPPGLSETEAQAVTLRTIRMIRLAAYSWGISAGEIGVMGIAKGSAAPDFDAGSDHPRCWTEQGSNRPDFVVLINGSNDPGALGINPPNAPPAFLEAQLAGWQDRFLAWLKELEAHACCGVLGSRGECGLCH